MNYKSDVTIIGSGIAGTILASILARQGLSVLVVEAKSHPRFAIGESQIIETSEIMRGLALLFDVPEIAHFSSENFFPVIGYSHGVKRHFSFTYHRQSKSANPQEILQAVIPQEPYGHELHIYRQDSDFYYLAVARKYGATVLQNTKVTAVDMDASGVTLQTASGAVIASRFLVDACGYHSLLARKYDLRDTNLLTHSRSIFSHLIRIPSYHDISGRKGALRLPYSFSEGTLHHLFHGGWLWVIPFNNHQRAVNPFCSVGLMLDPRLYPRDESRTAEEEFFSILKRFPSIYAQMKDGIAVRDWVRTDRIQYSSTQVVGDRFALLGHSAGFIDPLFSKGLYASLSCVGALAQQLLTSHAENRFQRSDFTWVETKTKNIIRANDRLIAYAYKSFVDYRLWHLYSVLWLLGAYLEGLKLSTARFRYLSGGSREGYLEEIRDLKLVGGLWPDFDRLSDEIYAILDAVGDDEKAIEPAIEKIKKVYARTDWIPFVFRDIIAGKNHLPKSKFRLRLFRRKGGFRGTGNYRKHFFSSLGWWQMGIFIVQEKWRNRPDHLRRKFEQIVT